MKKVISLGEIMLRLSPKNRDRILGSQSLEVNYGGGEANVTCLLAQLGIETKYVSKLPDNYLGDSAINHLRGFGIDTTSIIRSGNRIGIYFLENGFSVRNSSVIYDRAHSAFSMATIKDFEIDKILNGYDILLTSGITLGLSDNGFLIGKAFMKRAKELGLEVAFDFNYRGKLWTLQEARDKISQILEYIDIVFAGHLDFTNILNFTSVKTIEVDGFDEYYIDLCNQVSKKYNFKYIASSIREVKSASRNIYNGILYNSFTKTIIKSKKYDISIVDRVGSGDSFTAGLLYSYIKNKDDQYIIDFASASAALKHTISGDTNLVKVSEIEGLFKSNNFDVFR